MFMEYKRTFQSSLARMTQSTHQPVADRDELSRIDRTGRTWKSQWKSNWKRIGNCELRTSQSDLVSESQ